MARILLIDDNSDHLHLAKAHLTKVVPSYEMELAFSAHEGLQRLQTELFDAVVTDYQMPGMNGLKLLEQVRREGNLIPFVIFTGRSREEVAIEALNLGADYYLRKEGALESLYADLAHILEKLIAHRQAEHALRISEDRFHALAKQALMGIAILQEGKIVYMNPAGCAIMGYSHAEMAAWPSERFLDVVHPADRAFVRSQYQKRQQGNSDAVKQYDVRIITKEGKKKWLAIHSNPIHSMEGLALAVVGMDITDRKLAEEALRSNAEKFRAIIEQSADGIALMDEQGRLIEWNAAQEEIFGLTRAAVIGRSLWDVQLQVTPSERRHAERYKELITAVKRYLQTGRASWLKQLQEFPIQRPDGALRLVQQRAFPLYIPEGVLTCCIMRDITPQNQAPEEDLQQKMKQLKNSPLQWPTR